MKQNRIVIAILLVLLVLAVAACAQKTQSPVLTVEGGQIQGVASEIPGVTVFRGIPYAAGGCRNCGEGRR